MSTKRKVEVFTAGCLVCEETIKKVNALACSDCEIIIYDLNKGCETNVCRDKAKEYGVNRVPAVAVDGKLLECCAGAGITNEALKAAGIGSNQKSI